MELCDSCRDCGEACKYSSILFVESEPNVVLPFINPGQAPCYLCDEMPCSAACPTGALEIIQPETVRMGKASLDPMRCLCLNDGKCKVCFDKCPLQGRALIWDDEINAPLININYCTGCGVCQNACPSPENPIMIIPS